MTLHGFPAAITPSGISFVTTDPEPMTTNKDKEYWLKQLEEFEADTGEQVKLEQD